MSVRQTSPKDQCLSGGIVLYCTGVAVASNESDADSRVKPKI